MHIRLLLLASAVALVPAADPPIALVNATVIDGTGAPPRAHMTIVVRDRRIVSVAPNGASVPNGARVIDLSGQFVIPGLIDSHVHLGTRPREHDVIDGVLRSVFHDGVTTVRDMGGSLRTVRPLAEHAVDDSVPYPRIYYSAIVAGPGRWFTGAFGANAADGLPMGTSPAVRLVSDTSNVEAIVRDAKAAGVTGIKIYNTISPRLMRALATEAHRNHLRVWSHLAVDPGKPSDVLNAGVDVVSHGDQFRAELRPLDYAEMRPDDPRLDALLSRMKRAGTIFDPTLFIMLPQQRVVDTTVLRARTAFQFAAAMTRRALRAGIPVVAGTDAIGGSTANLHSELQLLVDSAGLTPLQALRAAGLDGARAIGVEDSLGSIAPGKLADLVVLSRDPSADIRNTRSVVAVMKGGAWYPIAKVR